MIIDAYRKIKEAKNKYGTYYKAVFHLHTPESHDYKLRKEWESKEYKEKTTEDIFCECVSEGVLPEKFDFNQYELKDSLSVYLDKKEWLSYVLLAHCLMQNDVGIVVVTDHNTMGGVKN